MEHHHHLCQESEGYPVFSKANEDMFLDSLLDLLDEWSDDSSRQTSISDNTSNDDELLINEIIALSESPTSLTPTYSSSSSSNSSNCGLLDFGKSSSAFDMREEDSGERLCHICNEKAGKHVYYGGQCCPSCRAFFRRSVQNNFYKQFTCSSKTNACTINIQTRKSCQLCRFQSCLAAGMKVSWVLPDGERTSRKPRISSSCMQISLPSLDYSGGLTYKEISFVFSVKTSLCNKFIDKMTSMVNSNAEFLIKFVDYLAAPTNAEASYIRMGMALEKIEFLSLISSGMNSDMRISQRDMLLLYDHNNNNIFLYRESSALTKQECPTISSLIESVKVMNLQNVQTIEKIPKIKEFNIEHFLLQYKLLPQENPKHARFLQLIYQISSWNLDPSDHRMDDFCYIIMIFMMFFDLDNGSVRAELDDPAAVESARLVYVTMLKRYLQKKDPRSVGKRFLDGIMLPALVREALGLTNEIGICKGCKK